MYTGLLGVVEETILVLIEKGKHVEAFHFS